MTPIDRRSFLNTLAAAGLSTGALSDSIAKALDIAPRTVTGTLEDVRHIVVLMQENRSFDHYFGRLRGVRGFNDPRAVKLYGSGDPVFAQPNTDSSGVVQNPPTQLPFRPGGGPLGLAFLPDLAHGWRDAHGAWNNGRYDGWIQNKSRTTMAYLERADLPFHYALADAFTVCDAYHCSTMTSTDPNRYYLWTGWCGQGGANDPDSPASGSTPGAVSLVAATGNGVAPLGPVVTNAEAGYNWRTYPERLSAAGIGWKVYQDTGAGLTAEGSWGWGTPYIGNYGDNALLYFTQYQTATPGSPLFEGARRGTTIFDGSTYTHGTLFDQVRSDVLNDTLPQVSWIVAPEAESEHPNWPAGYGAWYISNMLSALTANPTVWASTVFIICYDENDGYFDHVVPPTPPMSAAQGRSTVSTVNELYPGTTNANYPAGPYGLGARVPMIVVSPWSKGGWVCSETLDATSIIRFIERRFGVREPNISPWRRAVCGDLTSAFDFSAANPTPIRLPSAASYAPPQAEIDATTRHPNLEVVVPDSAMPTQEPGLRLARALPYRLQVDASPVAGSAGFKLDFTNNGTVGAWFHVRTANDSVAGGSTGPWGYTVEPGKSLADRWTAPAATGTYDLSVHAHNGFFRRYAGGTGAAAARIVVKLVERPDGSVSVLASNVGSTATTCTVTDLYLGTSSHQVVQPGASFRSDWRLDATYHWYDFEVRSSTDASFVCQLAGHVETGAHGVSDPRL